MTTTKTTKRAAKKSSKPSKIVPRPSATTKPTKAERVAALVSGAAKPEVKKATKPLKVLAIGDEKIAAREAAALIRGLGIEGAQKLAKELGVDITGKAGSKVPAIVAQALHGREALPSTLRKAREERTTKAAKKSERKPRGESRVDVIATLLRREKGATVNEIAATLLSKFPTVSARWGGGKAELSQYVAFARTAIGHFGAGRLLRGELKGKVAITEEKRDGQGVYKAS